MLVFELTQAGMAQSQLFDPAVSVSRSVHQGAVARALLCLQLAAQEEEAQQRSRDGPGFL